MGNVPQDGEKLRAEVRGRYGRMALQVMSTGEAVADGCCGSNSSCCGTGSSCCGTGSGDAVTGDLYSSEELGALPVGAALASLGCGNPTALAELRAGEKVLDLGSGGGIDVLLSARRVGPTGFAYGLDMTDAMLELAERNRVEAGIENVRFLKGVIEDIPLPENSVDVVISNCVINLSADKGQVLREAYRVLVPGGRLAVSDIIFQGRIPETIRGDMEAWAGCIAGALEEETYRQLLHEAGFIEIEVEVTRRYALDDIADGDANATIASLSEAERADIDGKLVSAFIRARKPASM
ncbi:MAG TPA: arsenite methyltransferase [Ktedonobacteraceae bacterium]|jgi:arsenite methyltransferase|nr:arsenite methyltransferase [Ktedonobacteraceae bacterium]